MTSQVLYSSPNSMKKLGNVGQDYWLVQQNRQGYTTPDFKRKKGNLKTPLG